MVEFPSKELDVSKLAEQFGGGGHKLASGARVDKPLAISRDEVLDAVEKRWRLDKNLTHKAAYRGKLKRNYRPRE